MRLYFNLASQLVFHTNDTDVRKIMGASGTKEDTIREEAQSAMHVALITNTKGGTTDLVMENKYGSSFESYRYIVSKGRSATTTNVI